jgi:hypothetical protein
MQPHVRVLLVGEWHRNKYVVFGITFVRLRASNHKCQLDYGIS